jgi:endoglucanase
MSTTAPMAAAFVAVAGADPAAADELRASWRAYEASFMSADGRAIDRRGGHISTSEGQAYAMLRALWVDDADGFAKVWRWTNDNLQGGDAERLPAWKWGKTDEKWGVLDPEPASDADQLIAWALLGAADRWGREDLRAQGESLIRRIWEEETEEVGAFRVMLPGPWAKAQTPTRLNPSYFLPFAWRDFARADPDHDWMALLDDGYVMLDRCRAPSGLPKDWCYFDRNTGEVVVPEDPAHDNFGFEAFRVGWTLAAEAKWSREKRARVLLRPFVSLLDRLPDPAELPGIIGPDGEGKVEWEYPGMYGALLPGWALRRPTAAQRAWDARLAPLRGEHGWGDTDDYYSQNWIWFGLALWRGEGRPS